MTGLSSVWWLRKMSALWSWPPRFPTRSVSSARFDRGASGDSSWEPTTWAAAVSFWKPAPSAEGVLFPLLYDPGSSPTPFQKQFEARYHVPPDYAAAHTFDGVNLLIAAIRRGGLNRARIGDALRGASPSTGVTGAITWDSLSSNPRPVPLGTYRAGRIVRAESARATFP